MAAGLQIAAWAFATALVVAINIRRRFDPDALGIAVMLALIWTLQRVLDVMWSPAEAERIWPLFDFLAGATCFAAWRTRRERYKLALTGLFLLQLCAHVAYQAALFWRGPAVDHLTYLILVNTTYGCQLSLVGWRGLHDHAVVDWFRARLPHRSRPDHHPGPR